MPLKKLLFFSAFCVWALLSCQKTKQAANKSSWVDYKKTYNLALRHKDSAFYYYNKFVSNATDSLQIATAYDNMALIQSNAGDYFGAQESLLRSLNFLNSKKSEDRGCLASDYNELGMNTSDLKNYEAAIAFYDRAILFTDSANVKRIILNNKAYAYQEKKNYAKALKFYDDLIKQIKPNSEDYARILTNTATTKSLQDVHYDAAPELLKALNIRKRENDLTGQNSSYAHLSDYYIQSYPDSALLYARAMYANSLRLINPDDRLHALQRLIKLVPGGEAKLYFERYQHLSDSLQTARNAAKNQFALIRYDVEKQKSANLKLQKDNSEDKYQLFKQQILLYSALFVFIVAAIFAVFWYKKRKQALELEAKNAISENQLKTSKKVHDVVANGLYRMMTEIENQEGINKDQLLDKIEDMYEKSRDISYEKVEPSPPFHQKITGLLTSFATENIKVLLVGNNAGLWLKTGANIRYEIEHILQELMVNMKKHSRASNVAVRFEQKDNRINIYYIDNGIGLPEKIQYKNGLTSTGNRINNLHGTVTFDSGNNKGLKIFISFPIS